MGQKKGAVFLLAVALLALAFWYGGDAPGLHGWTAKTSPSPWAVPSHLAATDTDTVALPTVSASALPAVQTELPTPTPTPKPTALPAEVAPEGPSPCVGTDLASCTVSIRCDTLLDHIDAMEEGKRDLVPEDGVILASTAVTFEPGESAFDVLRRVCQDNDIHMEFTTTPVYNSAYIEGIQNLYEFDCGELSGWMYCVNGQYLSYSASAYSLQNGDVIEWQYTCQRGEDLQGPLAEER